MIDSYHRSLRNSLLTVGLDRAASRRAAQTWIETNLRDKQSRHLIVHDGLNLFHADSASFEPAILSSGEVPEQAWEYSVPIFLGHWDQCHVFAHALDAADFDVKSAFDAWRFDDLQSVGPLLEPGIGGLMAYARAMAHWHKGHRFCGWCGGPTRPAEAGHVRVCVACERQHFPRTDPAVIVLVTDGDRCLMGRQIGWPEKLYSVLAGFVEPGESIEQTVVREIREEAGIGVSDVHYWSSQPWPFPSSLMLGFTARALSNDIRIDKDELADARWFSRDDLVTHVRSGALTLPSSISIARKLIEHWYEAADGYRFHEQLGEEGDRAE